MPQHFHTDPGRNAPASTPPARPAQQHQAEKFVFPGSLSLHLKRLTKGTDLEEYHALHSLRYQVYCHEAHFLNPDEYPAELEIDEFDTVSEHFIATKANSNHDIVGTVRLVRWSEHLSFPTAVFFKPLLDQLDHKKFPHATTAEISRLCISKQYRKRTKDGLLGVDGYLDTTGDQRRKYPEIILELFKIMYLASRNDLGITHWIATFETSLYRLLDRYGVHLDLLTTEEIDYYGKVRIYGASIHQMEETMKRLKPELFAFFCKQQDNA